MRPVGEIESQNMMQQQTSEQSEEKTTHNQKNEVHCGERRTNKHLIAMTALVRPRINFNKVSDETISYF